MGPPPAEGGRRPRAEAAASPQGWPPPKTSLPFRRFLIVNGINPPHLFRPKYNTRPIGSNTTRSSTTKSLSKTPSNAPCV
jgi:hypothetical protein